MILIFHTFPQMSQVTGRTPVWVIIWVFKVAFSIKLYKTHNQNKLEKDYSLAALHRSSTIIVKTQFLLITLPHSSPLWALSPMCILIWLEMDLMLSIPSEPESSLGAPLARFGRMVGPSPGSLRFAANRPETSLERSECPSWDLPQELQGGRLKKKENKSKRRWWGLNLRLLLSPIYNPPLYQLS